MTERATCCVVGGGPAGLFLGLLLARAGVEVTVLEKHADFLRDFRGDTVHTSTLTLIDELGLWDRFERLPWKPIEQARVTFDAGTAVVGDLSRLHAPHPFIAMVPQWHLLDLLAAAAEEEPTFTLRRGAELTDLVHEADRVTGVRWRDRESGEEHVLSADLVVACDGRDSRVREASGLAVTSYDVPMDVWWFRLPREGADDPAGGLGRVTRGQLMVFLDRDTYFQVAYLIPRGTDATYRARPISALRDTLRTLVPWLGDRVEATVSWDDVKFLAVALNRLRTWSAPGVLCIGDAAHAMSPIGGIGINLAVQDAVATARALAPVLQAERGARPDPEAVDRAARRVQRRRVLPTALTQAGQRLAHRVVLASLADDAPGTTTIPLPLRVMQRFPALQAVPARVIGIGLLPEHAPRWARRSSRASTAR